MSVFGLEHRLTDSVMAFVCNGTGEKLECINAGSILVSASGADSAGMIEATWVGLPVRIFRRDLEERSVEITPIGEGVPTRAAAFGEASSVRRL